jgi:hypothetical protein
MDPIKDIHRLLCVSHFHPTYYQALAFTAPLSLLTSIFSQDLAIRPICQQPACPQILSIRC